MPINYPNFKIYAAGNRIPWKVYTGELDQSWSAQNLRTPLSTITWNSNTNFIDFAVGGTVVDGTWNSTSGWNTDTPSQGQLPLRFVLIPTNPSEYYLSAANMKTKATGATATLGYGGPYNDIPTYYGSYTSVTSSNSLYPGWDGGLIENLYTWDNGSSGLNNETITLESWCSRLQMYNWDISTQTEGIPPSLYNVVVVLAFIKPEVNIVNLQSDTSSYYVSDNTLNGEGGWVKRKFFISLDETAATPISEQDNSNDIESNTTTGWTSWDLKLTTGSVRPHFDIVPWLPNGINNGQNMSQDYPYQYTKTHSTLGSNVVNPWGKITFQQTSAWNAQSSQALPNGYNNGVSYFWLVPHPGYVLSRHHISFDHSTTGTTGYIGAPPWVGALVSNMPDTGFSNTGVPDFWTEDLSYNSTHRSWGHKAAPTFAQLAGPNQYTVNSFSNNLVENPWPFYYKDVYNNGLGLIPDPAGGVDDLWSLNTAFENRGTTKWNDITMIVSNSVGLSESVNMSNLDSNSGETFDQTDITLHDTHSYGYAIPVWGLLNMSEIINDMGMSSIQSQLSGSMNQGLTDVINSDHGLEWNFFTYENGQIGGYRMPENYCANDWAKNAVLVEIKNLGQYIPGENPPDIEIKVYGEARSILGEEACVNVEVLVQAGGNN